MPDDRPWYREPETFIALAALVVSVSAVVVGVYEAALQRRHDRAEVWPHPEIATFITPKGASVYLQNNGIGPAIVRSIEVAVDGKPVRSWADVLAAILGKSGPNFNVATVAGHGIRAGDRIEMLGLPAEELPPDFWKAVGRVAVTVCYASVFGDLGEVTDVLGTSDAWREVDRCPAQRDSTDF